MLIVLFFAACFVAFTNGANANFKGVASLYGSGTTTLRRAALWGTVTTFAGAIASLVVTKGLLATFSGRGIVPDAMVASHPFVCAVAIGGALTSFIATRLGFPVSTTHALVGALLGAALASGGGVRWAPLGKTVLLPLIVSPFLAAAAGAGLVFILNRIRVPMGRRTPLLDSLHFLSTGAASFARGLNDTPKIAALLVLVPDLSVNACLIIVAVVMALGGLLDIDRVAETLGKKITGMNAGEGFAVSLVTASLVATASLHSLPVSTTHVSVGSLLGMGASTGQARWRKVGEILFAWVSTVPCGAIFAAMAYWLLAT